MLTPIATRIQARLLPMLFAACLSLALGACSDSVTEEKTPSDAMDPEPTPDPNPEPTPNPDVTPDPTPDPMPGPEPEDPIRATLFVQDSFGVAESAFEFNAEANQYETHLPNDTNDYVVNPGATSWWIEVEDTATGESWTLRESEGGVRQVGLTPRTLSAEGTRNPVILSASYMHVRVSAPSLGREATVNWRVNPDFYSPTGEQYGEAPWEISAAETLDGVIEAMDGLDDESRRAHWQEAQFELQRSGGMPVSLGLERHFVFYDMLAASPEEAGPFAVGAAWRDWDPSGLPMAQVEGTRWFWATDVVRNTPRTQYKLVYLPTEVWFRDPSNPHMVWDGFDTGSVGAFNSEVHFDATDNGRGRTVALSGVYSPELDNRRDVYVHLPPGYDDGDDARFPIMIFHDGNESLTRADFARVMDDWSVETGRQVIGVFVHLPSQDVRLSEYTFLEEGSRGDAYADFLVQTLLPIIDDEFRTIPSANARAIHGMSLGGLISYYVAMRHPTVFGRVGGMSSSFFWAELALIDMYRDADVLPVSKFYLDSGSPNDNFDVTQIMAGVLEDKGYDVTYVVDEGGTHDWSFWRDRLPGALNSLWAGF